jgi:hypothetical protein
VNFRKLLTKLNDTFRPMHVDGQSGSDPLLDGRAAGRAGNLHAASPSNSTDWAPSQQDEEAHHS